MQNTIFIQYARTPMGELIVSGNGHLVGYAGGLLTKRKLLNLETALNEPQLSLF